MAEAITRDEGVSLYAYMARKNPGIARLAKGILLGKETDAKKARDFAMREGVEYAIVGPEAPLEVGIVDLLEEAGIPCAGPTRAAARLETDKAFCRDMMAAHGIAGCPRYRVFHDTGEAVAFIEGYDGDLAVKPIGLTGGKGVRVMGEQVDRLGAIAYVKSLSGNVVLEERLIGEEFTLQAFVDGSRLVPAPLVQDHKRAFEGDTGPNTGGMGAYSEDSILEESLRAEIIRNIVAPTLAGMAAEGTPYQGFLYCGLMLTAEGPKLLEYNVRMGDPEAQVVLPMIDGELAPLLRDAAAGRLGQESCRVRDWPRVGVVVASAGYPDQYETGKVISGLGAAAEVPGVVVFHAGTKRRGADIVTAGGRVLTVVAEGQDYRQAVSRAYEGARRIAFDGAFMRKDIGIKAIRATNTGTP